MLSILRSLIFEVTSNSNSFSRTSLRLISSSGVVRGQKRLTKKLDLILLSVMLRVFVFEGVLGLLGVINVAHHIVGEFPEFFFTVFSLVK